MLGQSHPVVAVEGFTGPFDLLVRLVERRELDVLAISLADVADQYLEHLSAFRLRDPEHLTAFLVVAAKLLLIKSALLLPTAPRASVEAVVQDPTDLTERLRVYRQFRQVADWLGARAEAGQRSYLRPPTAYVPTLPPVLAVEEAPQLLRSTLLKLLARPPAEIVPTLPAETRMTVAEAIELLRGALARLSAVQLNELVAPTEARHRLVATFLAILELVRVGQARAEQALPFGEIVVESRLVENDGVVGTPSPGAPS
jgi:segregation and condensation protein A